MNQQVSSSGPVHPHLESLARIDQGEPVAGRDQNGDGDGGRLKKEGHVGLLMNARTRCQSSFAEVIGSAEGTILKPDLDEKFFFLEPVAEGLVLPCLQAQEQEKAEEGSLEDRPCQELISRQFQKDQISLGLHNNHSPPVQPTEYFTESFIPPAIPGCPHSNPGPPDS